MEKINDGDIVLVVMTRNNVFPFQSSPSFEATFHHAPQGPGDTFVLEVDKQMLLLNGNSAEFVALVQLPKEEKHIVPLH